MMEMVMEVVMVMVMVIDVLCITGKRKQVDTPALSPVNENAQETPRRRGKRRDTF